MYTAGYKKKAFFSYIKLPYGIDCRPREPYTCVARDLLADYYELPTWNLGINYACTPWREQVARNYSAGCPLVDRTAGFLPAGTPAWKLSVRVLSECCASSAPGFYFIKMYLEQNVAPGITFFPRRVARWWPRIKTTRPDHSPGSPCSVAGEIITCYLFLSLLPRIPFRSPTIMFSKNERKSDRCPTMKLRLLKDLLAAH